MPRKKTVVENLKPKTAIRHRNMERDQDLMSRKKTSKSVAKHRATGGKK